MDTVEIAMLRHLSIESEKLLSSTFIIPLFNSSNSTWRLLSANSSLWIFSSDLFLVDLLVSDRQLMSLCIFCKMKMIKRQFEYPVFGIPVVSLHKKTPFYKTRLKKFPRGWICNYSNMIITWRRHVTGQLLSEKKKRKV